MGERKSKASRSSKKDSRSSEASAKSVEAAMATMTPELMMTKMQEMFKQMSPAKDASVSPSKTVGVPPVQPWSTPAYFGHGHVETIPQDGTPVHNVSSGCNTVFTNISNMVERVVEVIARPVDNYVPPMTLPRPGTCHVEVNTSITNDNKGAGRVIDLVHLRARREERITFTPKLTFALTSAVDIMPAPSRKYERPSQQAFPTGPPAKRPSQPAVRLVRSEAGTKKPAATGDVWERMDNYIAWLHSEGKQPVSHSVSPTGTIPIRAKDIEIPIVFEG